VKPGDSVSEFDNICEVQSDKATVSITSRYAGIVKKIHHDVEGTVKVGEALIDIEVESAEDVPGMTATVYVCIQFL
jgi:2-oxoisovalerate dehydrogenase E2 component (dihydrolipoyl transacylase)